MRGLISPENFGRAVKNFTYIHVEKLRAWGRGNYATREYKPNKYTRYWGVTGCWEHDMRTIETANAVSSRFAENSIVCSETGWKNAFLTEKTCQETGCRSPDFIAQKAQKILSDREITAREDQVKVSMLLMAVSPEYLRDGDIDNEINLLKVKDWKASTVRFLQKKFGDGLLAIVFHEDELNPHASAYVLPLVQKEVASAGRKKKKEADKPKQKSLKWRLSHNEIFTRDPYRVERGADGKDKKIPVGQGTLSLLQEEYAEELQRAGMIVRRGVRRAPFQKKLEHETNQERYERLSAPVADIEGMSDAQLRKWAVDASVKAAEAVRLRVERDHYQTAAADAQEQLKTAHNELAQRQRSIPVKDVIFQLTGIDPRPTGKPDVILFVMPNGQKISVNEASSQFQNLTSEIPFSTNPVRTRGRGAIDAVQFLTGWSFEETTEWLSDTFSGTVAVNAATQKAEHHLETSADTPQRLKRRLRAQEVIEELETPEPGAWAKLVEILFSKFRISLELLKQLHGEKRIFANRFGHMVVQKIQYQGSTPIPAGNIIIDPNDAEIPVIETGSGGIIAMHRPEAKRVIIATSPMDGFCLKSYPDHVDDAVIVVGSKVDDSTVKEIGKICALSQSFVCLAENLSKLGQEIAAWLKTHFPGASDMKLPPGFKTWSDYWQIAVNTPKAPKDKITTAPKSKDEPSMG